MPKIIDIYFYIAMGLLLSFIVVCLYKFALTFKPTDDHISDLIEKQSSKFDEYYKESIRINKILDESEEDCVIIDGVTYVKTPKPTYYWKRLE